MFTYYLSSFLIILFIFSKNCFAFYYNPTLYVPKYHEFLVNQANLTRDLFATYDATVSPIYTKIDPTKPIGYDPDAPKRWNYTVLLYSLKLVEVVEPEEKVSVVMEVMEVGYCIKLSDKSNFSIGTIHDYVGMKAFMMISGHFSPVSQMSGVRHYLHLENDLIDFRDQDFRLVCVNSVGMLYDYISVRVSANCPMDVYKFPFDSQICQIRFCLPVFNSVEVQITNDIYQGVLKSEAWKTMGNSEWKLTNLTNRVETLRYDDGFGNLDLLNVGLTNIMTMTFILGVMSDKIPRTGTVPMLGVYIIVNLVIMIIAIAIVTGITELRRWALPKLKKKQTTFSRKLETFIGPPLEYICAVLLELMTLALFLIMIGFWLWDN
uniref:Neur_chan_LBD domain-containing protein n=1 Tax=Caenorhabditis tropicalis TaxID=1561998 RepID=A0A1I7TZ24_9PELO